MLHFKLEPHDIFLEGGSCQTSWCTETEAAPACGSGRPFCTLLLQFGFLHRSCLSPFLCASLCNSLLNIPVPRAVQGG